MTRLTPMGQKIWEGKYAANPTETYSQGCVRVAYALDLQKTAFDALEQQHMSVGGRVWYGAGKRNQAMINCVLLDAEDSKEGWAKVLHDTLLALTNGCGVGVDYGKIRPYGSEIKGSGGTASGAVSLMRVLNGVAKPISQGNTLRSALLASLPWWHGDIFEFIQEKIWNEDIAEMKSKNIDYPAPLDFTNCSVRLDSAFIAALGRGDEHATKVWEALTYAMFSTGEPGITFNLDDQIFRNACGEIISNHPNDVCVLASINLDKMKSLDMVVDNVNFAMHTLIQTLRHTVFPTKETESTSKNYPRVGLGFMGLHNWLIAQGERYEWNSSLQQLMKTFKEASRYYGDLWARYYGLNSICGYNAIAPTGSISRLFGGITSGIEPIFSKATKWEYTLHGKRETSISIDSNIQRYLEDGINVDEIEDAYDLASSVEGFERRVALQANVQDYIDNGISSTIQLARWGSDTNNERTLPIYRKILLKYLPRLRGITCYPDGARSGQPLTRISVAEALEYSSREERNSYSNCSSGLCAT